MAVLDASSTCISRDDSCTLINLVNDIYDQIREIGAVAKAGVDIDDSGLQPATPLCRAIFKLADTRQIDMLRGLIDEMTPC